MKGKEKERCQARYSKERCQARYSAIVPHSHSLDPNVPLERTLIHLIGMIDLCI